MKGKNTMNTPLNLKTVTLKMKRIELCDLLVATTLLAQQSDAEKWHRLHDKLLTIIDEFDEKNLDLVVGTN